MRFKYIFYWTIRLTAAVIMVQTLYFKFTGSEESVYIFTTAGIEPWGRILVGILELIASLLLIINLTAWIGAALSLALMSGAIFMHLTILGISVNDDGGQLFLYAITVAVCSLIVIFMNKEKIILLSKHVFPKHNVN
jgi:uncharacterized membrane protein YphA (DoxX/SURF4 family)